MALSSIQKVLLTTVAVGSTAAFAGYGTFAAFTTSTAATSSVSSGTVNIAMGAAGSANNRLTVNASGIVPGDTIQRAVQLSNTGTQNLASVTLTSAASPSSLLDTDATNGLQLNIDACSVPWTEAGSAPAYTYTCSGTTTAVLASRAVVGSNIPLSNLSSLTAGTADNLRVTATLPSAAGNTFQGLTSTLTYTFTGVQRTATNK